MKRLGLVMLALGGGLGLTWLLLRQGGVVGHWAGSWVDACSAAPDARAKAGDCIDCVIHGCDASAALWFGSLPVFTSAVLLLFGGLMFAMCKLRRG